MDLPTVLAERLTSTHPDVVARFLATFIHTPMGAEADALCGSGYDERSDQRTNSPNGYRQRRFDTRAVLLELAIPKLRQAPYVPDWRLERRKRAERALTTVVATCCLLGVSTRRMDRPVETLGITWCASKSGRLTWCGGWLLITRLLARTVVATVGLASTRFVGIAC